MKTRDLVAIAVYRLNLGVGTKEFVREIYDLAVESSPVSASILPLPLKPLRDFMSGRKSYGSYRRAVRNLTTKISAVVNSERAYVGPVVVRYGGNTFLSVVEAASGSEISKKFIRYGGEFRGHVPRLPNVIIGNVSVCFLILDDVFYPETARYCAESGSSLLVSVLPPIADLDPELAVAAARVRAYENGVNVVLLGGYVKDRSIPTAIVRRDGSVVDIVNEARSEVIEIQLAGESTARPCCESMRRYFVKAIKMLNSSSV
ncbi:MAG: hypothetical protein RMH84_02360 [Sulfolobales archaeon]|nr:hypothetical protein [Sulfolobales archaeon]MDW8010420.1 hypothetical protein [Sulfolobales archaeon]